MLTNYIVTLYLLKAPSDFYIVSVPHVYHIWSVLHAILLFHSLETPWSFKDQYVEF